MAFVYDSSSQVDRKNVWNQISHLITIHKGSWVLVGDFNQVENNDQNIEGSKYIKGATRFLDGKLQNNLIDEYYVK